MFPEISAWMADWSTVVSCRALRNNRRLRPIHLLKEMHVKTTGERTMAANVDEKFYTRADSFIDLANEHAAAAERDDVSASLMYSSARFNAWVSATGFSSKEEMRAAKPARIAQLAEHYRMMLEENMESYIKNFDDYMKPNA